MPGAGAADPDADAVFGQVPVAAGSGRDRRRRERDTESCASVHRLKRTACARTGLGESGSRHRPDPSATRPNRCRAPGVPKMEKDAASEEDAMQPTDRALPRYVRGLGVIAIVGLLMTVLATPAEARRLSPPPTVEIHSGARLAVDGGTVQVDLAARCPERWTVVEARLTVTQAQATGAAPFSLSCTGGWRVMSVTVPAADGVFRLADAQVDALVRIERGRTEEVRDSDAVRLLPTVFTDVADMAALDASGGSAIIDVTYACPAGATPVESSARIVQGQVVGAGTFMPVCDGSLHTVGVTVTASGGVLQPGSAWGSALVLVTDRGDGFYGLDLQAVDLRRS